MFSVVDVHEGAALFKDTELPTGTTMVVCPYTDVTKHPVFFAHVVHRSGISAPLVCMKGKGRGDRWQLWYSDDEAVIKPWFREHKKEIVKILNKKPFRVGEISIVAELDFRTLKELGFPGIASRVSKLIEAVRQICVTKKHLMISTGDYFYAKRIIKDELPGEVHVLSMW